MKWLHHNCRRAQLKVFIYYFFFCLIRHCRTLTPFQINKFDPSDLEAIAHRLTHSAELHWFFILDCIHMPIKRSANKITCNGARKELKVCIFTLIEGDSKSMKKTSRHIYIYMYMNTWVHVLKMLEDNAKFIAWLMAHSLKRYDNDGFQHCYWLSERECGS